MLVDKNPYTGRRVHALLHWPVAQVASLTRCDVVILRPVGPVCFRSGLLACWLLVSSAIASAQTLEDIDFFEKRIRPVLAENCFACHSPQAPQPMSGLRVDTRDALLRGGDRGPAVVPGKPSESRLIQAVRHQGLVMPPNRKLTDHQVADLEHWISLGAPWPVAKAAAAGAAPEAATTPELARSAAAAEVHWAFQPFRVVGSHESSKGDRDPVIDRLVVDRLKEIGLSRSERADPRTLLRRLSYGLTGLPPTFEQIQAFAADPGEAAYQREVDRLLASPHFGERWARHWLDTARYAEAGAMNARFAFAYTYRDWVVQALNDDMPYDKFVVRQLAADLVPAEDKRHLAALGFLTLGLNPFRRTDLPEKIDDRIDVVTRGLMGLSVSCARCHDHKFDPIPTEDYYSLYGVFLNSDEPLEAVPIENTSRTDPLGDAYRARLTRRLNVLRTFERERLEEHRADARKADSIERYLLGAWHGRGMTGPQFENLARERNLPSYLLHRWVNYLNRAAASADPVFILWNQLAALDGPDFANAAREAMSRENGASGANQFVIDELMRKPPASPGDLAHRYAELLEQSDSAEPHSNPDREALRLTLRGSDAPANIPLEDFWLTQTEGDKNTVNGLINQYKAAAADYAYRVAPPHAMGLQDVENPVAAHIFRRGNQNDLGEEAPRRFLKVLSRPDRRPFAHGSGRLDLARAIADPDNPLTARVMVNRVWHHLFGRGIVETTSDFGSRGAVPTHPALLDHLAATFVRDGWSIKGLIRRIVLSDVYQQSSGEQSVALRKDPENKLLWRMNRRRLDFEAQRDSLLAVSGRLDTTVGGRSFLPASFPSVPRRTLYSFVERQRALPSLSNFDMADPAQHTPKRHVTTVPQQALFMMNSPFVAEQARAFVASIAQETHRSDEDRIQSAYRRIFGREPTPDEVQLGLEFLSKAGNSRSLESTSSPEAAPGDAWRYGFGELDPTAGQVKRFVPFDYFAPLMKVGLVAALSPAWKHASLLPAADAGVAHLTAQGGAPGDDLGHSVIRRWISPFEGEVNISGALSHQLGAFGKRFDTSNGIRGWIVSGRSGILANWTLRDLEAETSLSGLAVEKGEILDFVVDSRGDDESDGFRWAPVIKEILQTEEDGSEKQPRRWNAEDDFRGPQAKPLDPWEQYVQVLLETNELAFVD